MAQVLWAFFSAIISKLKHNADSIIVIEKRALEELNAQSNKRSISLALSHRGFQALDQVGLKEKVKSKSVLLVGRSINHQGFSHEVLYDESDGMGIYSIERSELLSILVAKSKECNIPILFGHKICKINKTSRALTKSGYELQFLHGIPPLYCSYILGCDGANSATRSIVSVPYIKEKFYCFYKEGSVERDKSFNRDHLNIWIDQKAMTISLSLISGQLITTSFIYDNEDIDNEANNPEHSELCTIWCESHTTDNIAIFGDAAHSMVPFYGQGMNSGLEDFVYFSHMTEIYGMNSQTMQNFESVKRLDGYSICELALYNYFEMSTGMDA